MTVQNQGQFTSPQSSNILKPQTLVAAATISPQTKFIKITGTTTITTITPPFSDSYHELVLMFDESHNSALLSGDNIANDLDITNARVNRPITLYYDPRDRLYYIQATE